MENQTSTNAWAATLAHKFRGVRVGCTYSVESFCLMPYKGSELEAARLVVGKRRVNVPLRYLEIHGEYRKPEGES